MSDPILRLSGITKAYNAGKPTEVQVLQGIDLSLDGFSPGLYSVRIQGNGWKRHSKLLVK